MSKTQKIGVKTPNNTQNKAPTPQKKEFKFKEWDHDAVSEIITDQIKLLVANKNTYMTQSKLAARFLMTLNDFKSACFDDEDLSKLWQIYNGVYVEHIMNQAIQSGKMNAQTEKYLKDELQAYTGAGFEQHITWVMDEAELVDYEGKPYELEIDKDLDQTVVKPWEDEINGAEDKE